MKSIYTRLFVFALLVTFVALALNLTWENMAHTAHAAQVKQK